MPSTEQTRDLGCEFWKNSKKKKLKSLESRLKEREIPKIVKNGGRSMALLFFLLLLLSSNSLANRSGDIVPISKMGQYHSSRTPWLDVIGRHCPILAVNREVLIPIEKPVGYTGADPYKISFQVGREKFIVPWLLLINRKSSEFPMLDVHLSYSGSHMLGVTAKVVNMPHRYLEIHPNIRQQFWDSGAWAKHVLVRYTWFVKETVAENSMPVGGVAKVE